MDGNVHVPYLQASERHCKPPVSFHLPQFSFGIPDLQLKDIACSQALLERFLIFPSRMGLHGVRNAMCAFSHQRLQKIEDVLYANLDFFKIFKLVSNWLEST